MSTGLKALIIILVVILILRSPEIITSVIQLLNELISRPQ